jgi:steroid delta-isomerase-like uncharacterized protein
MARDRNIAIARRFIEELWNERQFHVADEIVADDFVAETLCYEPTPWEGRGPESIKRHIKNDWLAHVPDLHFLVRDVIADDRAVMVQWLAQGTHTGKLMGMTGKNTKLEVYGTTICHIEREKIVSNTIIMDTLGLLQQLGAVPNLAELATIETDSWGVSG